jgi:hypothetical protein
MTGSRPGGAHNHRGVRMLNHAWELYVLGVLWYKAARFVGHGPDKVAKCKSTNVAHTPSHVFWVPGIRSRIQG